MPDLPILAVLPDLLGVLAKAPNAVLVAPPGAGKTTGIAPALLGEAWCTGEILLLSPRRLAARAAAERMAVLAGEAVGGTIGYATRLDSKRSAKTRITVLKQWPKPYQDFHDGRGQRCLEWLYKKGRVIVLWDLCFTKKGVLASKQKP